MLNATKIGVCAKDLKGELSANLKWLSDHHFDCLQIWKPQIDESRYSIKEFKSQCDDLNLFVSAVGGGPNLVDPNCVSKSIDLFKTFIDLALDLGCDVISAETKILPKGLSIDQGWEICEKTIGQICDYAKPLGVKLAIECAGPCFINDHNRWKELSDRIDSDVLKVNFDAANIAWARQDPVEACQFFKGEIVHTHIKDISYLPNLDNMNDEQNHDCVLGEGIVDYRSVLRELQQDQYDGAYCIEMHSGELDRRKEILKSKEVLATYLEELDNNIEKELKG